MPISVFEVSVGAVTMGVGVSTGGVVLAGVGAGFVCVFGFCVGVVGVTEGVGVGVGVFVVVEGVDVFPADVLRVFDAREPEVFEGVFATVVGIFWRWRLLSTMTSFSILSIFSSEKVIVIL